MTDPESFVAAMAADPDADAPRLVYADWLEEHGYAARAGFIRDQVRLAKLRPGTDEYRQLFRRTADTLTANLPSWVRPLWEAFRQPPLWKPRRGPWAGLNLRLLDDQPPDATSTTVVDLVTFHRGFLCGVGGWFVDEWHGRAFAQVVREHPITHLAVGPLRPTAWEANVPALSAIRSLTLRGSFHSDQAAAVLGWPWSGLRRLTLLHPRGDELATVWRSPAAKRLTGLRMEMHPRAIDSLAEFPLEDRLHDFQLLRAPDTTYDPAAVVARLSAVAFRPTLKKLDLTGCTLGDAGLATFARGDVWVRLRALVLDRNRFGDPGWRDFVRGRRTPELRLLSASRNFVTDDGAVRLGQSPLAATLEYVDLRGNRIAGKGAVALARSLAGGPLRKLLLAGNPISPKDAATVCRVLNGRVDVGG